MVFEGLSAKPLVPSSRLRDLHVRAARLDKILSIGLVRTSCSGSCMCICNVVHEHSLGQVRVLACNWVSNKK